MTHDIEHILTSQYPSSVHDAVRYGYLYRKESEVLDSSLHFSLPKASTVLLWIASAVASGIVYDIIKEETKEILSYIKGNKQELDKETEAILENEDSLKEFTIYIEEYYTHDMKITVEQEKYIKEEVEADTAGYEASRIYKETGRIDLTIEERITIQKKAHKRAEELIHRHE